MRGWLRRLHSSQRGTAFFNGWALMLRMSLLGSLVVGCASFPGMVTYDHPSHTLAQKQRDQLECRALAKQLVGPDQVMRGSFETGYYVQCLESRGWVKVERTS